MFQKLKFSNADVEIEEYKWHIVIRIKTKEDVKEFIATADQYFTEGCGIWFGTKEDYEEEIKE